MKIKLSELRKLIREELSSSRDMLPGRQLGYGEGEGRMTKSHLDRIARYSQHLHDTLRDEDDLPEWVQSKIAVAADSISKVKHYLEYKIKRMPEVSIISVSPEKESATGGTNGYVSMTNAGSSKDSEDDEELLQDHEDSLPADEEETD
jgi:hypothetical protein